MNQELEKNSSFIAVSLELFRFTESYASNIHDGSFEQQYLLNTDLIIDFTKDLNLREVQFVEIFENYKKIVKTLSKFKCLDCPKFNEHVK